MGYGYDHSRLCCDNCSNAGGVRKRSCPHKVRADSLHSADGSRPTLSYCRPPALCADCYGRLGGLRGIHGDQCRDGAAASQAEFDAIEAGLAAGELFVVSAVGDWHADAPEGMVLVTFRGRYDSETRTRAEVQHLVPKDAYDPKSKPKLSDYLAVALRGRHHHA